MRKPSVPQAFVRKVQRRQRQILARLEALAWVRPAHALLVQEQRDIDALLTLYHETPQEGRK